MTILKNTKHPTDDIHHGMRALQGINDLVITASNCGPDLHLVNPENLSYLLELVIDRLKSGLDTIDPLEQRFG